jgi:hypothetical protein
VTPAAAMHMSSSSSLCLQRHMMYLFHCSRHSECAQDQTKLQYPENTCALLVVCGQ